MNLQKAARQLFLIGMAILLCSSYAQATTFTITKTIDTNDGVCNADCSLREAIIAANSNTGTDTIVFSTQVTPGTFTMSITGGADTTGDLNLNDNVIIRGSGENITIIDANGIDRVFRIAPGISAAISNLTISNGTLADDPSIGGGIWNMGDLVLENVTISGNTAHNGGGIGTTGNVTATNCTFIGNSSTESFSNPGVTGFGGAIFSQSNAVLDFSDTLITGNSSDRDGGGIYMLDGSAVLYNVTVDGNISGGMGGGALTLGLITLSNSNIINNVGNDGGGMTALDGGQLLISNSIFSGNIANGKDLGGGGAIFNYLGTVEITNTSISNNIAYGEGGGGISSNGILTISQDSTITDNQGLWHDLNVPGASAGFGGGLLLIAGGNVTIENVTISGNRTAVSGGGIYQDRNSTLQITDSVIENNVVLDTPNGLYGGGVLNEGDMVIAHTTISHNSAPVLGGAISTAVGLVTISDSSIKWNTADSAGGIGNFLGGSLDISDSTFRHNTATALNSEGFGGAILNDINSQTTVTNSTFSGNSAGIGGAISNNNALKQNGFGGTTLINVTITGNNAGSSTSAMSNWAGTVTLANTIINGTCNYWDRVENDGNDNSPVSLGGNLESPGNRCGLTHQSDQVNVVDMGLDVLTNNGGNTLTHALLAGSPAIDVAIEDQAPTFDQRGQLRPQEGNGIGNAVSDSGAYEYLSSEGFQKRSLVEDLVTDYYWNILGRGPDAGGLDYWTSEILRMDTLGVDIKEGFIALGKLFFNSSEYLNQANSNTDYVTDLYWTFLMRAPDAGGLNYWEDQVNGGVSRNTVLNSFVFSGEFSSFMASTFDPPDARPENNVVNDFYRGLLSRLPDSSGFIYWRDRFRISQCAGDAEGTRNLANEIAWLFINSEEYLNKGRNNPEYVEDLYDAILRRTGDTSGISFWVNGLTNDDFTREWALASFTASSEFQSRVDAVISAGCF